jgi:hypothetical protein
LWHLTTITHSLFIKQRIFSNVLTTFYEHIIYKYIGIVVNMFMLSFIFVIVFGLIAGKRIWAGLFIVCLYMYCRWRSSYQKEGRIVIPLTGITPPHVCACSKPGHGFSTTYIVIYFLSVQ